MPRDPKTIGKVVRVPVSPATTTVLGYRVKATSPMWAGLDLSKAEPRMQTTLELAFFGADAVTDIHLDVPWCHPEDQARGGEWVKYRVRPRMEAGKRWRGKVVKSVAFERWNGEWAIAVEFEAGSKT